MKTVGLMLCGQLIFTIDRIEGVFAVVEWRANAEIGDISSSFFPSPPREGESWGVRILEGADGGSVYDPTRHAIGRDSGHLFLPSHCRLTAASKLVTRLTRISAP